MAKGDYYFPLYYQRLLTSTVGWKDDEFGAYMRLLIYQFDKGFIPDDLSEIAGISPAAKKYWPKLSKKFQSDGNGGLINQVMDEIRKEIKHKKEMRTEFGKRGGRPPKQKPKGFDLENQKVSENESKTKPIPITNNQYPKEERESPPSVFFTIEHCLFVALRDERWVRANKTNENELKEFNAMLEKRGVYNKNPADYKSHFSNWKAGGKKEEKQEAAEKQVAGMSIREQKAQQILNG